MFTKRHRSERGQAIVLIALGIVGLVGMTALAIDGGNAFLDNRHAQNAADTSVLAAALAKTRGNDWETAGLTMAGNNGYENSDSTKNVIIHDCNDETKYDNDNQLVLCPDIYRGNADYIHIVIESDVDTFFAPIVGVEQVTNVAEAIGHAKPSEQEPAIYGNAIISLATTECQAYYIHGTAYTEVTGGGIFVNSDGSDCTTANNGAFEHQGSAVFIASDGGVNSVGSAVVQNPALLHPYPPTTGVAPLSEPPFMMPEPDPHCLVDATRDGPIISPNIIIDASWLRDSYVFLNPGLYCIYGDLVLNASNVLEGHDVTLYFIDGGLHINGKGTFNLDAPDSGTFEGLLIFLPEDNDSIVLLNGDANTTFEGTILAPASEIQINGTGEIEGYSSQIIGYIVDLIGTSETYINYDPSTTWDPMTHPEIELAQ